MATHIRDILFKKGLSMEIEIIPIAKTFLNHHDTITIPHRDNFYNIFWYQKGTANHLVDFKPIKVKSNSILFVNKNRVQMLDPNGGYDGKFLLFTDNFFDQYPDDIKYLRNNILFNDLLEDPLINIKKNSPIISLFNDIEEELSRPSDSFQYQILHNLLHNLLLMAERERRTSGFNEIKKGDNLDYTVLFKNLLEDNFKTVKSVTGYASLMLVSEKKLNKATTSTLGKSAKELIDERIVLEAKRVLAHTNNSIKEIGFELGFDEPTNFIKYFRKHENKTPIEFRKIYQR
ncbi:MAG: helix-turn-helix domain-containing protein [Chitinophagaceae bacterium]